MKEEFFKRVFIFHYSLFWLDTIYLRSSSKLWRAPSHSYVSLVLFKISAAWYLDEALWWIDGYSEDLYSSPKG